MGFGSAHPLAALEGHSLKSRIAAHLIVGSREEPFLAAALDAVEGAASVLLVNDNSTGDSPHARALAESRFGREGRLVVDRTPFENFAAARNVCMRLHEQHDGGNWVMYLDADEVHGEPISQIASRLNEVPPDYDFVDGYMWHFFQSLDWYTSIDREMMFSRYKPGLHWEGAIHEQLVGLTGKRIALPYVYAHFSSVFGSRHFAEKGRHYSSLGAPGEIVPEHELDRINTAKLFGPFYPRLMRFRGVLPPAARSTAAQLRQKLSGEYAQTDAAARVASPLTRLQRAFAKINFEQRWRFRALHPLARKLVAR